MALKPEQPRTFKSARELRLRYHIPIAKTARFWDELENGRLTTTRCAKCGAIFFPPVADCSECRSSQMEWMPLSGEAVLQAVTRIDIKPASFAEEEPYLIAIGKLKEGVNVLARLVGTSVEVARIGMSLILRPARTREGNVWYEFAPAVGSRGKNSG
ncbi:MAG: Zn-ribbon domain-containing OB-fold protein [Thaumarchaeota archaeon]|nr:Zn-ribbon domain-containing OB-fold protein [Nitrososphaerota archaeon]